MGGLTPEKVAEFLKGLIGTGATMHDGGFETENPDIVDGDLLVSINGQDFAIIVEAI